jgi:hypothetical protein
VPVKRPWGMSAQWVTACARTVARSTFRAADRRRDHLTVLSARFEALNALADELGYPWTVGAEPQGTTESDQLAQAIEDLDMEEDGEAEQ